MLIEGKYVDQEGNEFKVFADNERMLEKIKAEIEQIEPYDLPLTKRTPEHIRDMALEIVEKYAEQEQTDEWQNGYDMAWEEAKVFYEQEPCEDAISRQAVIEIIDEEWLCNAEYEFRPLVEAIEKLPSVRPQEQIPEQWQELKETIIEMRDNDGTGTQQEACKFLANYMAVLEKQMVEPQKERNKYE